jgi:hypothetical protein
MNKDLNEIYDRHIIHSSFLDKRTVDKCMKESYELGVREVLGWLASQDYLSDNVEYIIEEWYNLNPKTKS